MEDEYHANKTKKHKSSGEPKAAVGEDGILASDSEDERIVRENKKKRKAAEEDGEKGSKDEVFVKAAEKQKPPVKKQITKALVPSADKATLANVQDEVQGTRYIRRRVRQRVKYDVSCIEGRCAIITKYARLPLILHVCIKQDPLDFSYMLLFSTSMFGVRSQMGPRGTSTTVLLA